MSGGWWMGFGTAGATIGAGVIAQAQGWLFIDPLSWTTNGIGCAAVGSLYFVYGAWKQSRKSGEA